MPETGAAASPIAAPFYPDFAPPPAGYRDPLYAPRRLRVETRANGEWLIANEAPIGRVFDDALAPLLHWAATLPDALWLAERDDTDPARFWRRLSFAQGLEAVAALAGGLAARGLEPGARVMIAARNGIEHALVTYAAMALGAIAAPVSPQYAADGADPARLAAALALIEPEFLLLDDQTRQARAAAAAFEAGVRVIAIRGASAPALSLDSLRAAPAFTFGAALDPRLTAKILLTSGSTGAPKGVAITHYGLAVNAAQIEACFADPERPVLVNSAPWSHSLGANAVLHTLLHRGGALYVDHGQPAPGRFAETLINLREIAPTTHVMVPAGWAMLADALETDAELAANFFSRLKLMQYGGAALAQSVADRIGRVAMRVTGRKISFASGYGSTETGPTACNVHWINEIMGQIGLPVPGTKLKLAPIAGDAAGDKFDARLAGPQLFAGYYRRPDLTEAAYDEEGYYRLGDSVRFVVHDRPEAGLAFAGRLAEDFKLANGTFVSAGALRVNLLSAVGGVAADAIICGEGAAGVGALFFLNPVFAAALAPGAAELADLAARPEIFAAIETALLAFNARTDAVSARIARFAILPSLADVTSGEITDKGYLNQSLCRTRRAQGIEALFAQDRTGEVRAGDEIWRAGVL